MKQGKFNNNDFFNTDEILIYLKEIRKYPILSNDSLNAVVIKMRDKSINEKERKEYEKQLIVGNLRFVLMVAKQYQNQGLDICDLVSEGNIGLMKAAKVYDPHKDIKFISYAVWWVRQSIINSLNDNSRTIRYPSNIIQLQQREKNKDINFDIDSLDVNDEFDNSYEYINLPKCVNLSNPINNDGDELIDIIPNNDSLHPETFLNKNSERKKHIDHVLSVLDYRERTIIEKYYGLHGEESNLDELGEEFQCTRERIRQLKDRSLRKLRNESFNLMNYLYF